MHKVNIVWNVTQFCSFPCKICCVSAIHIKGFKQIDSSRFNNELSLDEKYAVIDQINPDNFTLDLSGGDLFINPDHVELAIYASKKLNGNLSLTVPGSFITSDLVNKIKGHICDIEMTLDFPPHTLDKVRSAEYSQISLEAIKYLHKEGFNISVHTVLRRDNIQNSILENIYTILSSIGIKKWNILHLFPVGHLSVDATVRN